MSGLITSVRWLADLCKLPPIDVFPGLATALLDDATAENAVKAYVGWWMRHPDQGSLFEEATRHLSTMSDAELMTALLRMGYDGLLYRREDEIVGHVFFQRHGADLCAFSCSVDGDHRGDSHSATFLADFVAFASDLTHARRARVGRGSHAIARRLAADLRAHSAVLGWRISDDGWIEFPSDVGGPGDDKIHGRADG